MFAVIFNCGNLFLRIAGKTAKIAKIRTRKPEPACHTVCDNIAKITTKMGVLGSYFIEN